MSALSATDFKYFEDSKLHFWPEQIPINQSEAAPKTAETFQWKKYLDPKNEEFFKEGDYTPPAPFIEIARNPTDANIRNWFKYLETKIGTILLYAASKIY